MVRHRRAGKRRPAWAPGCLRALPPVRQSNERLRGDCHGGSAASSHSWALPRPGGPRFIMNCHPRVQTVGFLVKPQKQRADTVDVSALRGWRRVPESNWPARICNPLDNRFPNAPLYLPYTDLSIRSRVAVLLNRGFSQGPRDISCIYPITSHPSQVLDFFYLFLLYVYTGYSPQTHLQSAA